MIKNGDVITLLGESFPLKLETQKLYREEFSDESDEIHDFEASKKIEITEEMALDQRGATDDKSRKRKAPVKKEPKKIIKRAVKPKVSIPLVTQSKKKSTRIAKSKIKSEPSDSGTPTDVSDSEPNIPIKNTRSKNVKVKQTEITVKAMDMSRTINETSGSETDD